MDTSTETFSKILAHRDVKYVSRLLFDDMNRLKPVPSDILAQIPPEDLMYWCNTKGVYGLATDELINWLTERIAGRKAIEIGAGNGVFGRALGIKMTDSFVQERAEIGMYYSLRGQERVFYGFDVQPLEAGVAVKRHKPKVVIASWVTELYKNGKGFAEGVDESKLLTMVDEYILIGNLNVHGNKRIVENPPKGFKLEIYQFPWVYSRAVEPEKNMIMSWRRT